MKLLQVLGQGCPKCDALSANAKEAAESLGIEYSLEKVTDVNKIMEMGVMITPALAVDGEVVLVGKVPPAEEIENILSEE